jgi:hypothetical protein
MKSLAEAGSDVPAFVARWRRRRPGARSQEAGANLSLMRFRLKACDSALTDGSAKSRREGIALPKHAVLACLSRCLRTVLRRSRGQVDNARSASKMSRERGTQGWRGTRFPESNAPLT